MPGSFAATSVERGRGPARILAIDVDRDPLRDRGEPRRRIATRVETIGGLPRLHERLLHRVLGEVVTTEGAVRNRIYEAPVLAIERADRAGLSAPEGFELGRVHVYNGTTDYPARHHCRAGHPRPVTGCR